MSQQIAIYNAIDSLVTKQVEEAIWPDLADGYEWSYKFTADLLQPFMYMMIKGIAVDHDKLKNTVKEVKELTNQKQEELDTLCKRHLNVNSPKDCQRYFYGELGVTPYKKGNSITCDDKALQRMAKGTSSRKPIREAKLVQEIRGLLKLSGTYLEIDFDEDGRFRCAVNPRGTVTGRISTSKTIFETGMNMQNLDPRFKAFLISDPGYILIEPDKAGAEWVVVAYLSGDANMIRVVEEGKDPHAYTASLMFGVEEELVQYENKLIGHQSDPVEIERIRERLPQLKNKSFIPRTMSLRQAGKKSNHGLNYDEGYRTFALHNEIIDADAKKLVELYHQIYPGIRNNYYKTVQSQLSTNRTLINCFGRKRKFLGPMDDKLYKTAYAHLPQSTVGDNLNKGLLDIYQDTSDIMKLCQLLAQVHDSTLTQYPDNNLDMLTDCIQKQVDYLNIELSIGGRTFTIKTDVKVGYNWGHNGMTELSNLGDRQKVKEQLDRIINNGSATK